MTGIKNSEIYALCNCLFRTFEVTEVSAFFIKFVLCL
jgi:hypothetical protein